MEELKEITFETVCYSLWLEGKILQCESLKKAKSL